MNKRLVKADATATEKVFLWDDSDEDWILIRASISKSEANRLLGGAPSKDRDIPGNLQWMERIFEKVVLGWSLTEDDEAGKSFDVPATVENFRELDAEAANTIQRKVMEVFGRFMGREIEELEGESPE